jgi:uncharacterized repeat protein (TIGR03806 family)
MIRPAGFFAVCILFCCAAFSFGQQPYGLTAAQPVGKFLNGVFPPTSASAAQPPATLSGTGAFSSTTTLSPAGFFIPYDLNAPFYSDNAVKTRWIAIPNDGSHDSAAETITIEASHVWKVPRGTVIMKHFELPVSDVEPALLKRLETRFLIKGDDDVFYGLTYKWRADNSNADLVGTAAVSEDISIATAKGGSRTQTWYYPSRLDCVNCHNPNAGGVLGPRSHQLNRELLYPGGVTDNQLRALNHIGIFSPPLEETAIPSMPRSARMDDASASLELRARSYLASNCSNCHQPGAASNAYFDARFETPLSQQNIVNGPLNYNQGIAGARVIRPQSLAQSMVRYRMNRTGPEQMPPLGRNTIDTAGVDLISAWINSLPTSGTGENTAPVALTDIASAAFESAVTVDPLTNDSDADGDPLTLINLSAAAHGTLVENADGTVTYTPNVGWTGADTFTYQANDGRGGISNMALVTITTSGAVTATTIAFTDRISRVPGTNASNNTSYSGTPVAVADMNGDGRDDIIRLHNGTSLQIRFQQPGGAGFTSYNFGTSSPSGQEPWGMAIADVNEDGINDIAAAGYYDGVHIYSGNAAATAWIRATIPGSDNQLFAQAIGFMDLNNDGAIDLFCCHDDGESWKFRNTGSGGFAADAALMNAAAADPLNLGEGEPSSGNYGITWTDYDNDGDFDLYISKCRLGTSDARDPRRINKLLRNDGDTDGNGRINYNEAGPAAGLAIGEQSWISDFADVDNDGDMDVWIGNHSGNSSLYRNNGDGTFTDAGAASGLLIASTQLQPLEGAFRDFNNDGWLDFVVTNVNTDPQRPHRLYRNDGDGTFTQIANPFSSVNLHTLACGDLDHDGFVDLYAGYGSGYNSSSNSRNDRLWINNANSNHWLAVQLRGRQSNRNGIGARIRITGPFGQQSREVRGGEGYGICHTFTSHFGLGTGTAVSQLTVRWPSGFIDTVNHPAVDRYLVLAEGSSLPPVLTDPPDQQHTAGQSVSLSLSATDPTGDPLTFSAANLPPGLNVNAGTGTISGTVTAAGRFSVSAGVSDGFSTAYQTFVWDVDFAGGGFAGWQSTTPGAGTTAQSDLDYDSLDDLLEYAFAGDPASGASPVMTLARDITAPPDNLAILYTRPEGGRADISYILQCSDSLGTWTDVSGIDPSITPNGDGTETVRYEHLETLPAASGPRCMFRVTVRLVP